MSSTIYLYVKQHNQTGLKYLGKTTRDPIKYKGSGTYWRNHCNKHGYDVTTNILLSTTDFEEICRMGTFFSQSWNIVESEEWANLVPESGFGGGQSGELNGFYGKKHTKETKELMSSKKKGVKLGPAAPGVGAKISIANKGRKWSEESKERIKIERKDKFLGWVWWTNGEIETKAPVSPGEGWNKGRLRKWWTNGKDNILSKSCPGQDYVRGRT